MNKLIQTNDKTRVRRGTVFDQVSLIGCQLRAIIGHG